MSDMEYICIDAYKVAEGDYSPCPNCGLIPRVWVFDNGRSTACGCGNNKYDHFSILAESISSFVHRNDGSVLGYDWDGLRKNWNKWVATGEVAFTKSDGKW